MLKQLIKELESLADSKQADMLQRFFKTGRGEYGEGDVFLGIKVPIQRAVARKYEGLKLEDIQKLLDSKIHDHRMIGLFILINLYQKNRNKEIVDFYLANTKRVNNWDLVDLSCHQILGNWLLSKDRKVLYNLAKSENLWEKRIAIISTYAFIREKDFKDTLKISEILLNDKHDLIHKAVGWMLREVGKKDVGVLEVFLKKHYKKMPRTMLRYSIEKFPEELRQKYLKGLI